MVAPRDPSRSVDERTKRREGVADVTLLVVRAVSILGVLALLAFLLAGVFAASFHGVAATIAAAIGVALAAAAAYAFAHPLDEDAAESVPRVEEFEGLS